MAQTDADRTPTDEPTAGESAAANGSTAGSGPAAESGRAGSPRRTRVVLAEAARRGRSADRLRADLAEQTQIGDALVRGLVRAQLGLALRLSMVVIVGLGGLPLLFAVAPAVGGAKLFGVNLPWLLLGVAAFPFLFVVGWAYIRLAERNEQDFEALVRRPER